MILPSGLIFNDELVTFSFSPGYGHMTLTINIVGGVFKPWRVELVFDKDTVARLKTYIETVERLDRGLDK